MKGIFILCASLVLCTYQVVGQQQQNQQHAIDPNNPGEYPEPGEAPAGSGNPYPGGTNSNQNAEAVPTNNQIPSNPEQLGQYQGGNAPFNEGQMNTNSNAEAGIQPPQSHDPSNPGEYPEPGEFPAHGNNQVSAGSNQPPNYSNIGAAAAEVAAHSGQNTHQGITGGTGVNEGVQPPYHDPANPGEIPEPGEARVPQTINPQNAHGSKQNQPQNYNNGHVWTQAGQPTGQQSGQPGNFWDTLVQSVGTAGHAAGEAAANSGQNTHQGITGGTGVSGGVQSPYHDPANPGEIPEPGEARVPQNINPQNAQGSKQNQPHNFNNGHVWTQAGQLTGQQGGQSGQFQGTGVQSGGTAGHAGGGSNGGTAGHLPYHDPNNPGEYPEPGEIPPPKFKQASNKIYNMVKTFGAQRQQTNNIRQNGGQPSATINAKVSNSVQMYPVGPPNNGKHTALSKALQQTSINKWTGGNTNSQSNQNTQSIYPVTSQFEASLLSQTNNQNQIPNQQSKSSNAHSSKQRWLNQPFDSSQGINQGVIINKNQGHTSSTKQNSNTNMHLMQAMAKLFFEKLARFGQNNVNTGNQIQRTITTSNQKQGNFNKVSATSNTRGANKLQSTLAAAKHRQANYNPINRGQYITTTSMPTFNYKQQNVHQTPPNSQSNQQKVTTDNSNTGRHNQYLYMLEALKSLTSGKTRPGSVQNSVSGTNGNVKSNGKTSINVNQPAGQSPININRPSKLHQQTLTPGSSSFSSQFRTNSHGPTIPYKNWAQPQNRPAFRNNYSPPIGPTAPKSAVFQNRRIIRSNAQHQPGTAPQDFKPFTKQQTANSFQNVKSRVQSGVARNINRWKQQSPSSQPAAYNIRPTATLQQNKSPVSSTATRQSGFNNALPFPKPSLESNGQQTPIVGNTPRNKSPPILSVPVGPRKAPNSFVPNNSRIGPNVAVPTPFRSGSRTSRKRTIVSNTNPSLTNNKQKSSFRPNAFSLHRGQTAVKAVRINNLQSPFRKFRLGFTNTSASPQHTPYFRNGSPGNPNIHRRNNQSTLKTKYVIPNVKTPKVWPGLTVHNRVNIFSKNSTSSTKRYRPQTPANLSGSSRPKQHNSSPNMLKQRRSNFDSVQSSDLNQDRFAVTKNKNSGRLNFKLGAKILHKGHGMQSRVGAQSGPVIGQMPRRSKISPRSRSVIGQHRDQSKVSVRQRPVTGHGLRPSQISTQSESVIGQSLGHSKVRAKSRSLIGQRLGQSVVSARQRLVNGHGLRQSKVSAQSGPVIDQSLGHSKVRAKSRYVIGQRLGQSIVSAQHRPVIGQGLRQSKVSAESRPLIGQNLRQSRVRAQPRTVIDQTLRLSKASAQARPVMGQSLEPSTVNAQSRPVISQSLSQSKVNAQTRPVTDQSLRQPDVIAQSRSAVGQIPGQSKVRTQSRSMIGQSLGQSKVTLKSRPEIGQSLMHSKVSLQSRAPISQGDRISTSLKTYQTKTISKFEQTATEGPKDKFSSRKKSYSGTYLLKAIHGKGTPQGHRSASLLSTPIKPNVAYTVQHPRGQTWQEVITTTGNIQRIINANSNVQFVIDTKPDLGGGLFTVSGPSTPCFISSVSQNRDLISAINNIAQGVTPGQSVQAIPRTVNNIVKENVELQFVRNLSPTLADQCSGKQEILFVTPVTGTSNEGQGRVCYQLAASTFCVMPSMSAASNSYKVVK